MASDYEIRIYFGEGAFMQFKLNTFLNSGLPVEQGSGQSMNGYISVSAQLGFGGDWK